MLRVGHVVKGLGDAVEFTLVVFATSGVLGKGEGKRNKIMNYANRYFSEIIKVGGEEGLMGKCEMIWDINWYIITR